MRMKLPRSKCVIKALELPTAVFVYMHFIEFTAHSALLMLALFSRGVWLSNRQCSLVLLRSFAVCVTIKNYQGKLGQSFCQLWLSVLFLATNKSTALQLLQDEKGNDCVSLHIKPSLGNDDSKGQMTSLQGYCSKQNSCFATAVPIKKNLVPRL